MKKQYTPLQSSKLVRWKTDRALAFYRSPRSLYHNFGQQERIDSACIHSHIPPGRRLQKQRESSPANLLCLFYGCYLYREESGGCSTRASERGVACYNGSLCIYREFNPFADGPQALSLLSGDIIKERELLKTLNPRDSSYRKRHRLHAIQRTIEHNTSRQFFPLVINLHEEFAFEGLATIDDNFASKRGMIKWRRKAEEGRTECKGLVGRPLYNPGTYVCTREQGVENWTNDAIAIQGWKFHVNSESRSC